MHRSLTRQAMRYAGVGAVATGVHMAVLGVTVEGWGGSAGWGSALGALVGAQVAFLGNRVYTFSHSGPVAPAWWRFQGTALAGGALGAAIVVMLTALGLHWLPAQALATGIVLMVTFLINHHWSFHSREGDPAAMDQSGSRKRRPH